MEVAQVQQVKPVDPFDFGAPKPAPFKETSPQGVVTTDAHAPEPEAAVPDPAPTPEADELTAEEKALAGIEDEPSEQKPAYDDNFKKSFKELLGAEDPETFKAEHNRYKEQVSLLQEENQGLKGLKDGIDKLPPHWKRALELEQREKGAGQKYLKELPSTDILAADAKKLSDKQLLDTYDPDHGISDDQWAMLKDPDADPDVVAAFKKRVSFLRQNAEDMHKKAQNDVQEQTVAEQKRNQEWMESYNKRVAEAIAHTKNSPMKAFLNDSHIKGLKEGTLLGKYFEADGITPKPELLTTLLKAEQYDKTYEATKKAWYKKGKADGAAEHTSGLPTGPRTGRAASTPNQQTAQQKTNAVLDRIERDAL